VRYDLENPSCSLVLIGKFNPAIFSPAWLTKVGIITDEDFEHSKVQVIHPEIAQFDARRFRVDAQPSRFQITSTLAPFVTLADDLRRFFGEKLPHTPISAIGINFHTHFRLESAEKRMALGRALAPITPWGAFGQRLASSGSSPEFASGMVSLVLQETRPDGRPNGSRRVEVQPSKKFDALRGVFIAVNDHFEVADPRDEDGGQAVMEILAREFDTSEAEYRRIVSELMDFAGGLA
jgi:hypothetical protein